MKATLAIITIGVVPVSEVLPLLTEHVSEQQITHLSLLGKMSREEVMEDYAVEAGEDPLATLLSDGKLAHVSRQKIERSLQAVIEVLDNQEYDVILLMSTAPIKGSWRVMRFYSSRCESFRRWWHPLWTDTRWG